MITDENSEWLERPNEGWSDRREILLPDDFLEPEVAKKSEKKEKEKESINDIYNL